MHMTVGEKSVNPLRDEASLNEAPGAVEPREMLS